MKLSLNIQLTTKELEIANKVKVVCTRYVNMTSMIDSMLTKLPKDKVYRDINPNTIKPAIEMTEEKGVHTIKVDYSTNPRMTIAMGYSFLPVIEGLIASVVAFTTTFKLYESSYSIETRPYRLFNKIKSRMAHSRLVKWMEKKR